MSDPIGFIGLGQMGFAIAKNVLQSGYQLRVFNRTPDKAKPLADRGALVTKTPEEVVDAGGIVVTMLSDDQAVKQVVLGEHGIVDRLGRDGIHLYTTTN